MFATLKTLFLRSLLLCLLFSGAAQAAPLASYSDYFSFVGQDEEGYLLFALDNYRSLDDDNYEAEHFGVLYAQHSGWVDLVGTGKYPNTPSSLKKIPDSSTFQFSGRPDRGFRIQSRANDLRLEVNPLMIHLENRRDSQQQRLGKAAAVLYWRGRTIPGRVIYEGLSAQNNKLRTHRFSPTWTTSQNFYLALQNGPPTRWPNLYLHTEGSRKKRHSIGFAASGSAATQIETQDLRVSRKGWSYGLYRWNKGWRMSLQEPTSESDTKPPFARLKLKQVSRKNISNWVLGGFAISVIEGTLIADGQTSKVLGFAEVIK